MTSTKHILIAAALALALGSTAQAFAGDSPDEPSGTQGRPAARTQSQGQAPSDPGGMAYPEPASGSGTTRSAVTPPDTGQTRSTSTGRDAGSTQSPRSK